MELSAELRLWWRGERPIEVERWFETATAIAPGPIAERIDLYLDDPGQTEMGVKIRGHGATGSRTEIKSLVARRGRYGWLGEAEIWVKASSAALALEGAPTLSTRKQRRLRQFAATTDGVAEIPLGPHERPDQGCYVEFTRVGARDSTWWSLGFESFGNLDRIEPTLAATFAAMGDPPTPLPAASLAGGYPAWLAALAGPRL